jgi:hypothetical protein
MEESIVIKVGVAQFLVALQYCITWESPIVLFMK